MSESNGSTPADRKALIVESLKTMGKIDRGDFELWEFEDLEDALGFAISGEVFNDFVNPSMRFMRGLLWLKLRRDHPQLQLDDFRTLDLKTLANALARDTDEEAPDPTGGGEQPPIPNDEPAPTASPSSATSGA